jgi:hypothetical protein
MALFFVGQQAMDYGFVEADRDEGISNNLSFPIVIPA